MEKQGWYNGILQVTEYLKKGEMIKEDKKSWYRRCRRRGKGRSRRTARETKIQSGNLKLRRGKTRENPNLIIYPRGENKIKLSTTMM